MNIREKTEEIEKMVLSPYASLSVNSEGRDVFELPCELRTIYQRDRDRIIHCKSFRRLKHKTQVFLAPMGDHYRTRLTHTLEVAQIARSIARSLRLNEDLTEAIALGHDLGHTPFGHAGERALNAVCDLGFMHHEQSIRVVSLLEENGKGLNLTKEVLDGILNHKTSGNPKTLEGQVVRFSDKIAYINHDIDDAIRGGIIVEEDIPKIYRDILGDTTKSRLNCLISDVVNNSIGKDKVVMSKELEEAMMELRKTMFELVYTNPKAKSEEVKVTGMLESLYEYYIENFDSYVEKYLKGDMDTQLPPEFIKLHLELGEDKRRVVCDYIAGMSDQYSIKTYQDIFIPKAWKL